MRRHHAMLNREKAERGDAGRPAELVSLVHAARFVSRIIRVPRPRSGNHRAVGVPVFMGTTGFNKGITRRSQLCQTGSANAANTLAARLDYWQGRRGSNPRPSVLETDALAN